MEYIRKRRLNNASQALIYSDKQISDIAYDSQFESPEAFTRSFKSIFKVTPKEYREQRIERVVFEKEEANTAELGHIIYGINKKPILTSIEEKKLVGYSIKTSIANNKIQMPLIWQNYRTNKEKIKNPYPGNITLGVFSSDIEFNLETYSEETKVTYFLGSMVTDFTQIPEDMDQQSLPRGKYAVFTHRGGFDNMRLSYIYIYGSWLPKSGFELSINPGFEWYDDRFLGPFNKDTIIDIYIPIK